MRDGSNIKSPNDCNVNQVKKPLSGRGDQHDERMSRSLGSKLVLSLFFHVYIHTHIYTYV